MYYRYIKFKRMQLLTNNYYIISHTQKNIYCLYEVKTKEAKLKIFFKQLLLINWMHNKIMKFITCKENSPFNHEQFMTTISINIIGA